LILVDSSVWVDYFNGVETLATKKLDSLLGMQPICTGDLILAEVLKALDKIRIIKPLKHYSVPCQYTQC